MAKNENAEAAAKEAAAKEAAAKEAAAKEAAAKEAAAKEAAAKPTGHVIAEGKSLTSPKGILGPGDAVTAKQLAGGDSAFKGFIKSGHIVKAG